MTRQLGKIIRACKYYFSAPGMRRLSQMRDFLNGVYLSIGEEVG